MAIRGLIVQLRGDEPPSFGRKFGQVSYILGIVGAFVASFLGQALNWYKAGESAGFIGSVVGAIIVLVIYGFIAGKRRAV
jgi:uncharacterized membrane protein YeaQ/YmgE (transglycosylase-associated protein family)